MSKAKDLTRALSKVVRKKREEAGFSQTELGERADLHRTYISNIERGEQNVSIEILKRLAEALGTTLTDLVGTAEASLLDEQRPVKLLLVEDHPPDVFMFRRCLERNGLNFELTTVNTGQKALKMVKQLRESELPDIIFLDLNLPGVSGHEILAEVKKDEKLRLIPVIVLTTSSNPKDIEDTYSQFANSYLTKPVDPHEFEESIKRVLEYWLDTSAIPARA